MGCGKIPKVIGASCVTTDEPGTHESSLVLEREMRYEARKAMSDMQLIMNVNWDDSDLYSVEEVDEYLEDFSQFFSNWQSAAVNQQSFK